MGVLTGVMGVMDWIGAHQWIVHIFIIAYIAYTRSRKKEKVTFEADEIAEIKLYASKDVWIKCKIVGPTEGKQDSFDVQIFEFETEDEKAKELQGKVVPASSSALRKLKAKVPSDDDDEEGSTRDDSGDEEETPDDGDEECSKDDSNKKTD